MFPIGSLYSFLVTNWSAIYSFLPRMLVIKLAHRNYRNKINDFMIFYELFVHCDSRCTCMTLTFGLYYEQSTWSQRNQNSYK